MSTATGIKAIEAGLDNIDVSISTMSISHILVHHWKLWWQFWKVLIDKQILILKC